MHILNHVRSFAKFPTMNFPQEDFPKPEEEEVDDNDVETYRDYIEDEVDVNG